MRAALRTGIVAALAAAAGLAVGTAADPKAEKSPHAEAIDLVLRTQADVIRTVEDPKPIGPADKDLSWWHDTDERTWVVRRPFGPGFIDSTHLFTVTYRVAGKDAAVWYVDTRKGTAERVDRKK